ncbi:hypothetical protein KKE19_00880 [Patescibacteria group bacterium]|nr:hypothetical protein [Patescibacteria group bacterium]MBU4367544.1 hypothetical protein [Patescibacteria group bacterium]MBU4461585.1 hypothetical protein [Patescibacteria group bacterium]MCG2699482.1 hypothetical protein [Candidatus Parcubacteria bacterium]
MPGPNNNQKIVFSLPEDITIVDVIFSILKNNGLEETPEESCEKRTKGKPSKLIIIRDAAKNIAENKLSEKDLVSSLQKQLDIPKETAEKLIKEIKEKIVSFAKKITIRPEVAFPSKTILQKKSFPMEEDLLIIKPLPTNNNEGKIAEENIIGKKQGKSKSVEKIRKTIETSEKSKPSQKSSDIYREPIE